jgi:hypothetical protein
LTTVQLPLRGLGVVARKLSSNERLSVETFDRLLNQVGAPSAGWPLPSPEALSAERFNLPELRVNLSSQIDAALILYRFRAHTLTSLCSVP